MYRLRGDVALALEDLNTALRLCGGRGKVGVQAYCQRGLLHRLQERQDEARADFGAAAKMGNKFAQKQVSKNDVTFYVAILPLGGAWPPVLRTDLI